VSDRAPSGLDLVLPEHDWATVLLRETLADIRQLAIEIRGPCTMYSLNADAIRRFIPSEVIDSNVSECTK
jgi:hypothetical protein